MRKALEWTLRPFLRPSLDSFGKVAEVQSTDFTRLVQKLELDRNEELELTKTEFSEILGSLRNKRELTMPYPIQWGLEVEHAAFLYTLVRLVKPDKVVESGVANGFSSYVMLSALARNSAGNLTSVDIRDDVGFLVPASLRERWQLVVLNKQGSPESLREVLRPGKTIDVFLHDSSHTYSNQLREYRLAWRVLRSGGYLLSDDVDSSFAFLDHVSTYRVRPAVLVGEQKVFGLVKKP